MTLQTEVTEEERTLAVRLLKAHSPEHIATAFIRKARAGQSAPEDLLPADYKPSKDSANRESSGARGAIREDFSDGLWFSINVGRKQNAEPKWILPMLMKSGGLKKGEVGAIRIVDRKTFIEIAPRGVERFLETIGPDMKIEGAITVSRVDGKPDLSRPKEDDAPRSRKAPSRDTRKPRKDEGWKKRDKQTSDPITADANTNDGANSAFKRKPRKAASSEVLTPAKAKKPHKKKMARAAAQNAKDKQAKGKKGGVKKGERKTTRKKKR
jgi:ATP-dependent RNA helicase DeaD